MSALFWNHRHASLSWPIPRSLDGHFLERKISHAGVDVRQNILGGRARWIRLCGLLGKADCFRVLCPCLRVIGEFGEHSSYGGEACRSEQFVPGKYGESRQVRQMQSPLIRDQSFS